MLVFFHLQDMINVLHLSIWPPLHHLLVWLHSPLIDPSTIIVPEWYAWMQCMLKSNKHSIEITNTKRTSNTSSRWRITKRSRFNSHPLLATYLRVPIIAQASKTTICILNIQVKAYHNMPSTVLLMKHTLPIHHVQQVV